MKTKILSLIICWMATGYAADSYAQANQQLSNLTSPTAVNVNLLPDKNNKRDLGSTNKGWRNLYLDSAVFLGSLRFVSAPGTENTSVGIGALSSNITGYSNTACGYQSLFSGTTASWNTAFGSQALYSDSTGTDNTAVGLQALFSNNGYSNTALGYYALHSNTTGDYNTATGEFALYSNTTALGNTAHGYKALYANTTGTANTANGNDALSFNTTGYYNTANGAGALETNTTGFYNTATGAIALGHNTTGIDNTANGYLALYNNTTGNWNTANGLFALYSNTTADWNTATGMDALYSNTTGGSNTSDGYNALGLNSTGSHNTAVGFKALYSNTSAYYNTAIGESAGYNVTSGENNTFLGYNANCGSAGMLNNATAIGNGAFVNSNNHIVIGNSSVTSIGGVVNWSNLSDGRAKKNIKQNVPGLAFINKLQPITYNLDLEAADKIIARPALKDRDGKTIQPSQEELTARKEKEQVVYTGFIAQDVEKAAKDLNYNFSGVDKPDNTNTLYGLRYGDFVVPLVKAVQELSQENDELQKQIDELKAIVFNSQNSSSSQTFNNITSPSLSLEQNIPNPFKHTTRIDYTLSQKFSSAQIVITDNSGKIFKQTNISGAGKGSVSFDASAFSSGTYNYSLIIDGKLIVTKQMVLAK